MAVILVFSVSCKSNTSDNKVDHSNYNETTQELIRIVEKDSRIKALLEEAIDIPRQEDWSSLIRKTMVWWP